jgi:hypothetical protein
MPKKDMSKRNVRAGITLGMLSFLHNKKAMIVVGSILIAIGAIGAISIGSIVVQDYATGNINSTEGRPYPIYGGIISPYYAQVAFVFVAIGGLGLLIYAATGTRWAKP